MILRLDASGVFEICVIVFLNTCGMLCVINLTANIVFARNLFNYSIANCNVTYSGIVIFDNLIVY